MHDAIIVGARCAGAATAMLLARKGYKVLLVDRSRFPSDLPHGHFVHRHGPSRLARWRLLDRVLATNCPPVTSCVMDFGDFPLVASALLVDGVPMGVGPRRAALDRVLIDAAVEAGVELRTRFLVEDVVRDGNCVTGIRGRSLDGGPAVSERASVTIGADGRRSCIAHAVGAASYDEVPTAACWYFSYWSDVDLPGLEFYVRADRYIIAHPTNDGLVAIFVGWPIGRLVDVRQDLERAFMGALDGLTDLQARVRCGHRVEPIYGATDLPHFYRKPYGPGWALVGDAGCHKDPILALGICDALRDAERLADALDARFSGLRDMQEALAEYEAQRNAASRQDYGQNVAMAQFRPIPPQMLAVRAAVRGDADLSREFVLARQGLVPWEPLLAKLVQPQLSV
jgi:flavin-dependent dehydrogenase